MAEFIGNAFEWVMTNTVNIVTEFIHLGEFLIGPWGAIGALILISIIAKRATK